MNETPYFTPVVSGSSIATTDLMMIRKKMKFWLYGIWISIGWILVIPMIGLFCTVIGMGRAFSDLGSTGVADPSQLANHISEVLIATVAGLVFSVIGIPALIVSIMQYRKWKKRLSA